MPKKKVTLEVVNDYVSSRDALVSVKRAHPRDFIIAITKNGKTIKTPISEIPRFDRDAKGVYCIKLEEGDEIVSVDIVPGE